MQQFLEKLHSYADISSLIVDGKKINPRDYSPTLIQDLKDIATRMYTGFFTPLEPQSVFQEADWTDEQIKDMGVTTSHPRMKALEKEAQRLQGKNPGFMVFGNQAAGRSFISSNVTEPSALTKGDFVALKQATREILYRLNNPQRSALFEPLIIENPKFWGRLFINDPKINHDLKEVGVYVLSRPNDVHTALANTKANLKPASRAAYHVKNPHNIFASTDQIKTGHNTIAQSSYEGEFHVAHTVLGPSEIPVEESKTYANNALAKIIAHMLLSLERLRGKETNSDLLSVHDGGVAFYLQNKDGKRYTELFTDPEFFPFSAAVMNKILSGPGVELAELFKSSPNFKTVMKALFKKVADVCEKDPSFKPTDLVAMDTAIQMAIPAKEFFKFYDEYKAQHPELSDRNICEEIALRHCVTVGDVQKIKVFKEPKFNSVPYSFDTEHYIEAAGHEGKSRAQVPEWVRTGPNVTSYHMLMDGVGAKRISGDGQAYWREGKINTKIAVPGMLSGAAAKYSSNLGELQSALHEKEITCRLGSDYWREFRDSNGSGQKARQEFQHAADTHRQNIRKILASHDYLYIPKDYVPTTEKEKRECLLLLSSAFVQRQVFQPGAPRIVMEKGVVAEWFIDIYKSLKDAGLIGQRLEDMIQLTDGPEESAAVINSLSRMTRPSIRHTPKKEVTLKLDEPENYTVAFYCSATNKNGVWKPDVKAYGRFLALNGIDLKLGGGNDGMMKAAADGYLEGLTELVGRGEVPKGKLHLIQCEATRTIESDYKIADEFKHLEAYIDRRCYATIEERRYDLQRSHMSVGGPGGMGTFEEIDCEFLAKDFKEKDLKMYLLSQSYTKSDGQIAYVYDYLVRVLKLKHADADISHTVGELETITRNNVVSYEARKREAAALAEAQSRMTSFEFPSLKVA